MLPTANALTLTASSDDRAASQSLIAELTSQLEKRVNEDTTSVHINSLQLATKKDFDHMNANVANKCKRYRSVVWVQQSLFDQRFIDVLNSLVTKPVVANAGTDTAANGATASDSLSASSSSSTSVSLPPKFVKHTGGFTVQQSTPVRVLHRRSALVRPRRVHEFSYEIVNEHYLLIDLVTQSGTYIKEFVHGDRGRTVPSLGSLLGCACDIIQLDVIDLISDIYGVADAADSAVAATAKGGGKRKRESQGAAQNKKRKGGGGRGRGRGGGGKRGRGRGRGRKS
jgi:hypothetical protein